MGPNGLGHMNKNKEKVTHFCKLKSLIGVTISFHTHTHPLFP